jgi:hypothetical protein
MGPMPHGKGLRGVGFKIIVIISYPFEATCINPRTTIPNTTLPRMTLPRMTNPTIDQP